MFLFSYYQNITESRIPALHQKVNLFSVVGMYKTTQTLPPGSFHKSFSVTLLKIPFSSSFANVGASWSRKYFLSQFAVQIPEFTSAYSVQFSWLKLN